MIRNPKDFGVWSAYPSGVHSVITKLEMLPFLLLQYSILRFIVMGGPLGCF